MFFPMNAKPAKDRFSGLMENDDYIAQEKIDGVRAVVKINSVGAVTVTTRGQSVSAPGVPIDITHRLPCLEKYRVHRMLYSSIIDSEITIKGLDSAQTAGIISHKSRVPVPDGLMFNAFDLLYHDGTCLFEVPQISRIKILMSLEDYIPIEFMSILPYSAGTKDKYELLENLWDAGLEGIMLKNIHGYYYPDKRPTGIWFKVKKVDSIDAMIVGSEPPETLYQDPKTGKYDENRMTKPYEKGWFGALIYELEDGSRGTVAGFTDSDKAQMSDGKCNVKGEYVGRWMELKYMEKTREGNLRHPRFIRLRNEIEK